MCTATRPILLLRVRMVKKSRLSHRMNALLPQTKSQINITRTRKLRLTTSLSSIVAHEALRVNQHEVWHPVMVEVLIWNRILE